MLGYEKKYKGRESFEIDSRPFAVLYFCFQLLLLFYTFTFSFQLLSLSKLSAFASEPVVFFLISKRRLSSFSYRNKLPIWKTSADTTHAKRVVYPAANPAHFQLPVSPLMAAIVAIQGKYKSTKSKKQ